ncbi:MAG TPA: L-threonylcarbamoyladenylate synthase [Candidatus Paceibacterota bacterium]|nr:L-threonylcarbamoyladenylate synthase [Candidatus Paceibacterota bacterium]
MAQSTGKYKKAIALLRQGGVGVLPTDTIYGLVGSARSPEAVARMYRLRRRDLRKPPIILIGEMEDLKEFNVRLSPRLKKQLARWWPGKVSVVLTINHAAPARRRSLAYLHRGTGTLAFRLPKPEWLRRLLRQTGPLIAPSANPEGYPPAKTVRAARRYFGRRADFYADAGRLDSRPSTLVKAAGGKITVLRPGAARV